MCNLRDFYDGLHSRFSLGYDGEVNGHAVYLTVNSYREPDIIVDLETRSF